MFLCTLRRVVLAMGVSVFAMNLAVADEDDGPGNGDGGNGNAGGVSASVGGLGIGIGGGDDGEDESEDAPSDGGRGPGEVGPDAGADGSAGGSADGPGVSDPPTVSAPAPEEPVEDTSSEAAVTGLEPAAGTLEPETGLHQRRDSQTELPYFADEPLTLQDWSLADFSGVRVQDQYGEEFATVEGVVFDPQGHLYLLTALDGEDVDGRERVIRLDLFTLDDTGRTLVLGEAAIARLPQMAEFGAVASAFRMVDSNERLHALLAAR